MSTPRCPTCGQHTGRPPRSAIDADDSRDLELEILTLDGASLTGAPRSVVPESAAGEAGGTPRGFLRERPVLGLFLAAAVALGALQLLDSLTGPPEPSNVLEEAGPEVVARPGDDPEAEALTDTDTTEAAANQVTAEERRTAALEADARTLQRVIASGLPDLAPYVATYRTDAGLVSLTGTTAFPSEPKLLALYTEVEGFAFMTSDEGTWGVNPVDPSDTFLVSYSSEVVASRTNGRHVFVDSLANGRAVAGVVINGVTGPFFEIPEGSEHLLVQDLGVLIMPPTGGSFLLQNLAIEEFSDGRVIAATAEAWVVQRCDDALQCTLALMNSTSGDSIEVPSHGAERPPLLSPDGTRLLYWASEVEGVGGGVLDPADGGIVPIEDEIDAAAVWTPDSKFLIWIEGSTLVIADATTGESDRLDLEVQPIAPALLITMDQS